VDNTSENKKLKLLHLISTIWFIAWVGYVFVTALRQAGFNWLIIFSLSGHSVIFIFFLVSLYLFAFFRGVSRNQQIIIEHPLTCTPHYMILYAITPFLGTIAGVLGMTNSVSASHFLNGLALGTLGMTFLIWVIFDPIIGLMETIIPAASRKHRQERLAKAKAERQQKQRNRELLLERIFAEEEADKRRWHQLLVPQAEKLVEFTEQNEIDQKQIERKAIEIGATAWHIGGITCMRYLLNIVHDICRKKHVSKNIVDNIHFWWDGIGSWRSGSVI